MSRKNPQELLEDEESRRIKDIQRANSNVGKTSSNNSTPTSVKSSIKPNVQQKTSSSIPIQVVEDRSKSKKPVEKSTPIKPPDKSTPKKLEVKPSANKPGWNYGTRPVEVKSSVKFDKKSKTSVGKSSPTISSDQKLTQRPGTTPSTSKTPLAEVKPIVKSPEANQEEWLPRPDVTKSGESAPPHGSETQYDENSASSCSMLVVKSGVSMASSKPYDSQSEAGILEESPPPSLLSLGGPKPEVENPSSSRSLEILQLEEEIARLEQELAAEEKGPSPSHQVEIQSNTPEEIQEGDTSEKDNDESRVGPREDLNEEEETDLNANINNLEEEEVNGVLPIEAIGQVSSEVFFANSNQSSVIEVRAKPSQYYDASSSQNEIQVQPNQNSAPPAVHDDEVQDENQVVVNPRAIYTDTMINDCFKTVMNLPNLPVDSPKMETRLSAPKKIYFKKEANRLYKAKFTIKNDSDAHMTFRVYSTDCVSILTKPEMGILEPRSEVEFDAICCKELFGERVAIFGFPIYSSRQFTIEATNILWKAFRSAYFPERYAEEHSMSLVPAAWSFMNEINIYRNVKKMFSLEEVKPIDWPITAEYDLDVPKFNRFWSVDNDIWKNILFENAEMNSGRDLKKIKTGEKFNQDGTMTRIFIVSLVIFFFAFVVVNYYKPESFEKDFFSREPPPSPPEPEGWFSCFKSMFGFGKKRD